MSWGDFCLWLSGWEGMMSVMKAPVSHLLDVFNLEASDQNYPKISFISTLTGSRHKGMYPKVLVTPITRKLAIKISQRPFLYYKQSC